jgi:CRP/FNR family transcriptional regulator, cyclic AMP receptor protein
MGSTDVWYGVVMSRDASNAPRLKPADHPFLRGMDREFIEAISQGSSDVTFETGDLLVREGDVADRFYLVFHGKVAVEVVAPDGPRRTVQTIGPGEVLGWSWISAPYVWQFDGRALKETRVVTLDAAALRTAMESHPIDGYRFLLRLLPVIGQRLENTRAQVIDLGEL